MTATRTAENLRKLIEGCHKSPKISSRVQSPKIPVRPYPHRSEPSLSSASSSTYYRLALRAALREFGDAAWSVDKLGVPRLWAEKRPPGQLRSRPSELRGPLQKEFDIAQSRTPEDIAVALSVDGVQQGDAAKCALARSDGVLAESPRESPGRAATTTALHRMHEAHARRADCRHRIHASPRLRLRVIENTCAQGTSVTARDTAGGQS